MGWINTENIITGIVIIIFFLIKEPPCNRREVGGEGRGAFGFVIGGLVYPLEIVYVHYVV